MKKLLKEKSLEQLLFQRNVFAALALFLAATLFVLSFFLFSKQERIVIVPPVLEEKIWVDKHLVSPTYLEQFGAFLSQNLLTKSPSSAAEQRNILLRHTSPAFFGALKQRLLEEEEVLKKQKTSYVFFPHSIQVDPAKKLVKVEGDRKNYANSNCITMRRESYILSFEFTGGRLLLSGVQNVESAS